MEQPLAANAENSRAKVQNVGGDSSAKHRNKKTGLTLVSQPHADC